MDASGELFFHFDDLSNDGIPIYLAECEPADEAEEYCREIIKDILSYDDSEGLPGDE